MPSAPLLEELMWSIGQIIGDNEITRIGLLLQAGQAYYVSFQARNMAGLWSPVGVSNPVVNGSGLNFIYLPLIIK